MQTQLTSPVLLSSKASLVSSSLQPELSPYPVPVEASRNGFCRDDLDVGQMLILGKDQ